MCPAGGHTGCQTRQSSEGDQGSPPGSPPSTLALLNLPIPWAQFLPRPWGGLRDSPAGTPSPAGGRLLAVTCHPVPRELSRGWPEVGSPGGRSPLLNPPLWTVGSGAPSGTLRSSFYGTWHLLGRCLSFWGPQTPAHKLPSSLLPSRLTSNARPRHSSKSRPPHPHQQLQGAGGAVSYLLLPKTRGTLFPKPTAEAAPSTSSWLARSLWHG